MKKAKRERIFRRENFPKFKYLSAGGVCKVYLVSKNVVLKTYSSKHDRDYAWERQKRACKAKLAPPTLGKGKYGKFYAYLSARAEIFEDLDFDVPRKLENRLIKAMLKLRMVASDLHSGNIGIYKNKIVVIDFGRESVKDKRY